METTAPYDTRTRHDQPSNPLPGQTTMLDLAGEYIPADWVKADQALFVPDNPLHYEAHRLQILLALLDRQAQTKPGQFNSASYITVLEKYTTICKQIKEKGAADDEEILDKGGMGSRGNDEATTSVGHREPASLDPGISTDNPLAG